MGRVWKSISLIVCAFVASKSPAAVVVGANFTPIGDLAGGGFYSRVLAISTDGRYVVGESESDLGTEPFIWSQQSGIVSLGSLSGTRFVGQAVAVSSNGGVVAGNTDTNQAFRWTQVTGKQLLGKLDATDTSAAWGMTPDGSVVVGSADSSSGTQAFRWTQASGMIGIGDIPGGPTSSIAQAVNVDGSVVVGIGAGTSTDVVEGFRWTAAQGMKSLGDLSGGHTTTRAYAVSADGGVVVGEGSSLSGTEAFRWTQANGMQGLGDLPGGIFSSVALAVTADGSIVTGNGASNAALDDAFIWDAVHGMRELKSVLITDYGLNLTGWTLSVAFISADGYAIAGHGYDPQGRYQAWIAVLPEPTTLTPLGLTLLLAARRKMARR